MSMKHLLTATLIATALASPLNAGSLVIECFNVMQSEQARRMTFEFATENWTGFFLDVNDVARELHPMSQSEDHLSWFYEDENWPGENNHLIMVYLLNRRTMIMTTSNIALDHYEFWKDYQTELGVQDYMQCVQPL